MKYILAIALFIPFVSNAQNKCIEKAQDQDYDLVLSFGNNVAANDSCILALLAEPNIKKRARVKVYCTTSLDDIPKSFFKLDHIKSLYIEGVEEPTWDNCKGENDLADFGAFKELEELQLVFLPVSSISHNLLLPKLKRFTAHYTCLGHFPEAILKSGLLEQLKLSYSSIRVISPNICKAKNLKELVLTSSPINELPKEVYELKNLILLGIDGTNITIISDEIANLKKLEAISALTMTGIEKCSASICDLPKLQRFECAFNGENVQPGCLTNPNIWQSEGLSYRKVQ